MRKIIKSLIVCIWLLGTSVFAQNEYNLVPNPSFEEMEGKLKESGSIFLASPWKSVNMNPVDLYSAASKSNELSVPENKYGEEEARTGSNYAGISFFGYRGKLPRTYLGTELLEPLKKGEKYCVKFHISMSDRSKYAINNIGLHLSVEPINQTSDANIYLEPNIISVTNKVYKKQFLWTPICGFYIAKGGEKYISIGNFAKDTETKQEIVRLSRDIGGRQTYDGYYYVDDVSVIPASKIEEKECACEKIAGGKMETEFKSFKTDLALKGEAVNTTVKSSGNVIETSKKETEDKTLGENATAEESKMVKKPGAYTPSESQLFYKPQLYQLDAAAKKELTKVVAYLKANAKAKIEIQGHSDKSDGDVKAIDKKRGFFVQKQLISLGIDTSRITYVGLGTTSLVSKTNGALNRRVTFKIQ